MTVLVFWKVNIAFNDSLSQMYLGVAEAFMQRLQLHPGICQVSSRLLRLPSRPGLRAWDVKGSSREVIRKFQRHALIFSLFSGWLRSCQAKCQTAAKQLQQGRTNQQQSTVCTDPLADLSRSHGRSCANDSTDHGWARADAEPPCGAMRG